MPAARAGTADVSLDGAVLTVSWYADSDGEASADLGDLDVVLERVVHEKTTLSGVGTSHSVTIYDDYGAVMHEDAAVDDDADSTTVIAVAMGQAMSVPVVGCGPCNVKIVGAPDDSGVFYVHLRQSMEWPERLM